MKINTNDGVRSNSMCNVSEDKYTTIFEKPVKERAKKNEISLLRAFICRGGNCRYGKIA